jgi:hypothetical protein
MNVNVNTALILIDVERSAEYPRALIRKPEQEMKF